MLQSKISQQKCPLSLLGNGRVADFLLHKFLFFILRKLFFFFSARATSTFNATHSHVTNIFILVKLKFTDIVFCKSHVEHLSTVV